MSGYYPPGFGAASDLDHVEGALRETQLDEPCPDCRGVMFRFGWRSGDDTIACVECDYQRDTEREWCCDAGPIGHGGRHWKEE